MDLEKIKEYIDSQEFTYDSDLPMADYLIQCYNALMVIRSTAAYVLTDYVFDDEAIYNRFDAIAMLAGYKHDS